MDFEIDLWIFGRIYSLHGRRCLQIGSIHNKNKTNCVSGLRRGVEILWGRKDNVGIWIRIKKKRRIF